VDILIRDDFRGSRCFFCVKPSIWEISEVARLERERTNRGEREIEDQLPAENAHAASDGLDLQSLLSFANLILKA
jgi:hypothetical protein